MAERSLLSKDEPLTPNIDEVMVDSLNVKKEGPNSRKLAKIGPLNSSFKYVLPPPLRPLCNEVTCPRTREPSALGICKNSGTKGTTITW